MRFQDRIVISDAGRFTPRAPASSPDPPPHDCQAREAQLRTSATVATATGGLGERPLDLTHRRVGAFKHKTPSTHRRIREMHHQAEKAARFLALHQGERPLLLANAWDAGSAKLLAWLGFEALATTSSGYAASLGRLDYGVGRDEALAHCAALVATTELPLSADLENGFADDPAGVAETVRLAAEVGLAGCSIEDWSGAHRRLYDAEAAVERVAAAAKAAHAGPARMVLTARAENYLRGNRDIEDTIARLRAFQEAGADVLYAPALERPEDIRRLLAAVELPVNVLARPGAPPVAELSALGVRRVSVGGSFALAAYGAAVGAAKELLDDGTYGFYELSAVGAEAVRAASG